MGTGEAGTAGAGDGADRAGEPAGVGGWPLIAIGAAAAALAAIAGVLWFRFGADVYLAQLAGGIVNCF